MHATLGKQGHLVNDVKRFCGMSELTKDFVERDHQAGNQEARCAHSTKGADNNAKLRISEEQER